jgi:hypothetical protein
MCFFIYIRYYWNQCSRKCQCELFLLKTPVINHMDARRSSQWVSPDDGDIRRRNICQEVIVVNKSVLVGDFVNMELFIYTYNYSKQGTGFVVTFHCC